MGVDFCTDLVDENWIRELVAAWTARDAKQPIPAVRWPDPERTLVYLSNSPYDWPEQFRKMLVCREADFPDGDTWYACISRLIQAVAATISQPEGLRARLPKRQPGASSILCSRSTSMNIDAMTTERRITFIC